MTHALKCDPLFFAAIVEGVKLFDVRKNDRSFSPGDKLLLQEYDREDQKYSGKEWEGQITYILDHPEFCKKGTVILGIKEREPNY